MANFELAIRAMAAAANDQVGPPPHRGIGRHAGVGQRRVDDVQNQKLIGVPFGDQVGKDADSGSDRSRNSGGRKPPREQATNEASSSGGQLVIVAIVPAARGNVADRVDAMHDVVPKLPRSTAPGKTQAMPTIAMSRSFIIEDCCRDGSLIKGR